MRRTQVPNVPVNATKGSTAFITSTQTQGFEEEKKEKKKKSKKPVQARYISCMRNAGAERRPQAMSTNNLAS